MFKTLKYKFEIWKAFTFDKPFRIGFVTNLVPKKAHELWVKALEKRGWIRVDFPNGECWHHPKKDWPPYKPRDGYSAPFYYNDELSADEDIMTEIISSDDLQREKAHFNVIDGE